MASIQFPTFAVVGGLLLPVQEWSAEFHAYSGSDSCSLAVPLSQTIDQGYDLFDLAQRAVEADKALPVEIHASELPAFGSPAMPALFSGIADSMDANFDDDLYHLTGRSWAYLLMTARTAERLANQTISDIMIKFATRRGLNTDIDPSTAKAGTILPAGDQVLEGKNLREWDLLTNLATYEGRELFVQGKTLSYKNPIQDGDRELANLLWMGAAAPMLPLRNASRYAAPILSLRVEHWAQFSHDIIVQVTSHHPTKRQIIADSTMDNATAKKLLAQAAAGKTLPPVTVAARRKPPRSVTVKATAPKNLSKEQYVFSFVGISKEECDRRALAIWKDLSSHEFVATVKVDFNRALNIHTLFSLTGTRTIVDQQRFRPKHVRHSFGDGEGPVTELLLTSHSVQSSGTMIS